MQIGNAYLSHGGGGVPGGGEARGQLRGGRGNNPQRGGQQGRRGRSRPGVGTGAGHEVAARADGAAGEAFSQYTVHTVKKTPNRDSRKTRKLRE